jgi:hypothetical protein
MIKPLTFACLSLAALLYASPDARATDDPFHLTDGVWVGHVIGQAGERVTVELSGTSLVILDAATIAILSYDRWQVAGPGGKLGDVQLEANGKALAMASRAGQTKKAPSTPASALRMRVWPEQRKAVLCASDPTKKGVSITRVPATGATGGVDPGVTCYELVQVWSPAAAAPGEPDFECMRECRQQNMMRAVGPEVIEADCRASCTKR